MRDILFRASSVARLMTEPKSKADGFLSVGAKTYIEELAAQEVFGVDFIVSSKAIEKGVECEQDAIMLLNNVRGLSLVKNTERRSNEFITGECDLFDAAANRGHDIKTSWSIATFPIIEKHAIDKTYEWQARCYMALWNADAWEVNYCLVDTPERLIGFEPMELHYVSGIPEEMRVTTWGIARDKEKEEAICEKVKHAQEYFLQVIEEFDRTHKRIKSV